MTIRFAAALFCSAAVLGAPAAEAHWRGYGPGYGYGPRYYGGWHEHHHSSVWPFVLGGAVLGLGGAYALAPRYYAPPPVYYAPPSVYYAPPPVYYAPPPVYYQPPGAYYAPPAYSPW